MTLTYCIGRNTTNVTIARIKKKAAKVAKQIEIYFCPLKMFHFLKKNQLQNPVPNPLSDNS
jgi:hypothetical protein